MASLPADCVFGGSFFTGSVLLLGGGDQASLENPKISQDEIDAKKEAPSLFRYFQLSLLYLLTRCSCELFLSFYRLPLLN